VSYPDGVQAPDGSIYIIYDYQRQRDKQILMAVFNEADVIAGKFASPGSRQRVLINQASGINPTVPAGADQSNRNSNAEGAALLAGPGAVLECGDVEEDSLEPGKTLFLDRAHAVAEEPETLRGIKFQRGKIDGVHAVCRQAGVVYVMTPSEGRNPDSRETKLLGQDFQKVNLPEFPLFGGDPNLCSVFQKQMQVDEALDLGKWGVIVLP